MRNEIQINDTIAATVSLSDLTVTSLFRPIISRTRCLLLTASLGTMAHTAVNHSYLKDRRPSRYKQITALEADFIK